MKTGMRQDIQIYRAIAVILVVAYHLKVPGFAKGFFGVDIFFVISGFLMAQRFQVGKTPQFFKKRIQRLIPSYSIVIFATLLIGFWRSELSDFTQVIDQVRASVIGAPNVYFWSQDSYFNQSNFNPLLHLWSLGIEFAFYLVVPLVATIARRKSILFLLLLLSLISCWLVLTVSPKTAFFLFPFRFWEFLIGYIACKFYYTNRNHTKTSNLVLILLAFPVFVIPVDGFSVSPLLSHPGVSSLLICLATAMLLTRNLAIQSNYLTRFFVNTGNASYSIYLVHFPVIVYFWYSPFQGNNLKTPTVQELVVLLSVISVLSYLLYNLIESKNREIYSKTFFYISLVIVIILTSILIGKLKQESLSAYKSQIAQAYFDRSEYRCGKIVRILSPFEQMCKISKNNSSERVLLLGNSHADAIKVAFSKAAELSEKEVYFWVQNDPLIGNAKTGATIISESLKVGITEIYLHYSSGSLTEANLSNFILQAKVHSLEVVIIGSVPTWGVKVPQALWQVSPGIVPDSLNQSYSQFEEINLEGLEILKAAAAKYELDYLDTAFVLCTPGCQYASPTGKLFYWDEGHLTLSGASTLLPLFKGHLQKAMSE